jgi:hypothetical protein
MARKTRRTSTQRKRLARTAQQLARCQQFRPLTDLLNPTTRAMLAQLQKEARRGR